MSRTRWSWRVATVIFVQNSICRPGAALALYLGYLQPHRGLEQVISALVSCPEVTLAVMGEGEVRYVRSLRERADKAGVSERVHFLPLVPPDQVVMNARSADLGLVMSQPASFTHFNSLPNKLFQYLAAGLPVIASEFPELARIVVGHDVGVVCDPRDPRAIADAIREVTVDPVRHAELSANARATAESFNWVRESSKLLKIVEGLTRQ